MPLYPYQCMSCGYAFDEIQGMNDDPLETCPACKHVGFLKRLFGVPNAIVHGSPRCVGQLAEDNTRKLVAKHGKERAKEIIHERTYGKAGKQLKLPAGVIPVSRPDSVDIPWFRSGEVEGTGPQLEKPLDITTVKNTEKFIMTGDKT